MNKLPINFKDFLTVDYTQQAGTDIDPDGILAYQAQKRKKRLDENPEGATVATASLGAALFSLYKIYKDIKNRRKTVETKCAKLSGIEKDICVINVKIDEVEAKKKAVEKLIDPSKTSDPETAHSYKRKREAALVGHNNYIYRLKKREKKLKKKLRDQ